MTSKEDTGAESGGHSCESDGEVPSSLASTEIREGPSKQVGNGLDEEPQQHPLINSLILSALFDMLAFPELTVVRQVCKQWRDLSLNPWRQQAVLKVSFLTPSEVRSLGDPLAIHSTSLDDSLEALPEIEVKPFSSLKIIGSKTESRPLEHNVMQSLSFENLTYLKISNRTMTMTSISELVFSENSPPLKTFILDNVRMTFPEVRGVLEDQHKFEALVDLFSRPNLILETFNMGSFQYDLSVTPAMQTLFRDYLVRTFLRMVSNLHTLVTGSEREIPNLLSGESFLADLDVDRLKLRVLDVTNISGAYQAPFLTILKEMKLVELRIHLNDRYSVEELREVFGGNTESLRRLEVSRWQLEGSRAVALWQDPGDKIIFLNLEKLRIKDGVKTAFGLLSLLSCPMLEELSLHYRGEPLGSERLSPPELAEIDVVAPTVTRLNISREKNTVVLTPEEIERISAIFPNVQELRMPMTKGQFRVVCKFFKGLRSLHVLSYADLSVYEQPEHEILDDEGVTGLSQGQRLLNGVAEPNITDLKQLREFSLQPEPLAENNVYLTDHSVINGFLELPLLQILRLNMRMISNAARETLNERLYIASNYPLGYGNF